MTNSVQILAESDVETLLKDWQGLNVALLAIPIEAVRQLLAEAVTRGVRDPVRDRIYQRYSALQRSREREALKKGILPWQVDNQL